MSAPTWSGPPIGVMRPGFLAVSGCRPPKNEHDTPANWAIYEAILVDVDELVRAHPTHRIVHGGAVGVDLSAARTSRLQRERYLPDYKRHGTSAPMFRNHYVTTTERFIAWPAPWSRGTWDAVQKRLMCCGSAGFDLRLVGWGKGGEGVPDGVRKALGEVGAAWTEVEG